ncbi:polysaccharide biosynthesis protein [Caloranaerobacter azorensis H53214]|uniref:Polysaccharide biosynthesis protein n=1 Tax=Caloranaerobacter azorensis H53214 TaxID=1156417 RepID=A0A096DNG1_9FIRM|nr:polysaccharide biosynthesis protein [Caloranaerobacter azorensis]KGG80801.1 polysaccharide biosynthesis protein [Caloranaerobacter azorensis H53214]
MKKNSFIYGSIILAIVNFIVRFIGFCYKIILSKLIGPEGIGLFQMVFPVLMFFITITTAGIPIAVSKLVAKQNSINNLKGAKKIFKIALLITILIAIILSLIILIGSSYISLKILKNEEVNKSIIMLAPAVLIISISSIFRGYFYGMKKISPAGIAQIIEQIVRITFVLGMIYYMYPVSSKLGAFIAVCGISIGEIAGLIWMMLNYKLFSKNSTISSYKPIHTIQIISQIFYISVPITISRLINVSMQLINAVLIPQRLIVAGYSQTEAISIFGRVIGMSMPILFLPYIVTSALVINIIPNLSEELALKRYKMIKNDILLSLRITLLISIPLTFIYIFFSEPIAMFFYEDKVVGIYLGILGYSTIFLSLQHVLSGILHGLGKQITATINYLIGMLIQISATYFLVGNPIFGIKGFFIGFISATIIISLLHYISIIKIMKINFNIIEYIIKPIISSISMIIVTLIIYNHLISLNTQNYINFLICLSVGGLTYFLILTLIKGLPPSLLKKLLQKK